MLIGRRFGPAGACLALGLAGLALVGTATPAGATTLRRMDFSELVAAADRVVHARVVENQVHWDSTHSRIFTDTVFEVINDAKGSGPKRLTITQLGGRIDPVDMLVEGTPTFSAGEEVVLFSELHPSGQRLIVGFSQGVMRVHEDPETGHRVAVSDVAGGVSFVGGAPKRAAAPLDALLDQVRQVAAGEAPGSKISKTPAKDPVAPKGGKP